MNKVMSRDELEEVIKNEEHDLGIFVTELNKYNEKVTKSKHLNLNDHVEKQGMFSVLISQSMRIKNITNSHLAQSHKLDQAVELLGEMVNLKGRCMGLRILYQPSFASPEFPVRCICCEGKGSSIDGVDHHADCPVGRTQAFIKEVKGECPVQNAEKD